MTSLPIVTAIGYYFLHRDSVARMACNARDPNDYHCRLIGEWAVAAIPAMTVPPSLTAAIIICLFTYFLWKPRNPKQHILAALIVIPFHLIPTFFLSILLWWITV